eukprot:1328283-Rhodomonas_salina.3
MSSKLIHASTEGDGEPIAYVSPALAERCDSQISTKPAAWFSMRRALILFGCVSGRGVLRN